MDRYLDVARSGPLFLRQPAIAQFVIDSIYKGATAREANKLLNRTGEPFWQKESYDHWVRNAFEFGRIVAIDNNPVKAGLAKDPGNFPWSSAASGVRTRACRVEIRLDARPSPID